MFANPQRSKTDQTACVRKVKRRERNAPFALRLRGAVERCLVVNSVGIEAPRGKVSWTDGGRGVSVAPMRLLLCIVFAAAAWQLQAQDELPVPTGSYASELPHGANAKFVFRAAIGDFTNGPVNMQLIAQEVATQADILTLLGPAQLRGRVIKATFSFGGRYTGRYNQNRNVIVGHFSGFSRRGRPNIPRQRFEMAPVTANTADAANLSNN